MIVRGPTVPAGSLSMELTSMMDFVPTFMEMANVTAPTGLVLDGKSFAHIIDGSGGTTQHDHYFYWREHELYAVRGGPYKLHFITRPGFGFTPPTVHDPPLLFDVEQDPAEAMPLNVTHPEFAPVAQALIAAAKAHKASLQLGPSLYEGNSYSVVPCCNKAYNQTEAADFIRKGEYGLAIWDQCVCSPAMRPLA